MTNGPMAFFCKALDLERKALDFYSDAKARCPSQLGRAVFSLLCENKMRLATRLTEIHVSLNQGMSLDTACVLSDDEQKKTQGIFEAFASKYGDNSPACKLEMDLLFMAMDVERACLSFLEEELGATQERDARAFLQRAIEEERGHYVMLSDMRYYYEQAAETPSSQQ